MTDGEENFSAEDLALVNGDADQADDTLEQKPMTAEQVGHELDQIAEMRRSGSRAYWADDVQERERQLISAQQTFAVEKDAPAGEIDVAAVDKELDEIADLRKNDSRKYWEQKTQDREAELYRLKEIAQVAAERSANVRDVIDPIIGGVEDAAAFEEKFSEAFDGIGDQAKVAVVNELVSPTPVPMRYASESELQAFASTEEGKACVEAWGAQAPQNLAALKMRLENFIVDDRIGNFIDGLSTKDAEQVFKALVR